MKEKPVMTDTVDEELDELLEALHECDAGSKGYAEYYARITTLFASRTITAQEAGLLRWFVDAYAVDKDYRRNPLLEPTIEKLRLISNGN